MEFTEFKRVWDIDPPTADLNTMRSDLLMELTDYITELTDQEACDQLEEDADIILAIRKGRLSKFTLDALVLLATKAGMKTEIKILI